MKIIFRISFITIFLLMVMNVQAQNFYARMNALLAEVDASDIEYNITQIANATATTLANFQITNTAIIPFRDENNHRTGLTEFIAAEFGKVGIPLDADKVLRILDFLDNALGKST